MGSRLFIFAISQKKTCSIVFTGLFKADEQRFSCSLSPSSLASSLLVVGEGEISLLCVPFAFMILMFCGDNKQGEMFLISKD